MRLPSESAWEYACRVDWTTRRYWGDDPDYLDVDTNACYAGNGLGQTHAVGTSGGTHHPNGFGLHDTG